MPKPSSVAIIAAVVLGVPILLCGGCLTIGIVGSAVTPRPKQAPEVKRPQSNPAVAETPDPPLPLSKEVITAVEFSNIKTGMTYESVVAIIGAQGEEVSRSDLAGINTVMYAWKNPNGSNANVMLQNGKVVQKSQFGLQ